MRVGNGEKRPVDFEKDLYENLDWGKSRYGIYSISHSHVHSDLNEDESNYPICAEKRTRGVR